MSSTLWAVRAAHIWRRETHIFRFLRDAQCAVRIVEVRLFKTSRLSDRVPMDTRRWEPGNDLEKKPRNPEVHRRQWMGRCHDCGVRRNLNRSRHTGLRLVGSAQRMARSDLQPLRASRSSGRNRLIKRFGGLQGQNSPHRRQRSRQRDCSDGTLHIRTRQRAAPLRGLRNMLASTPSRRYVRAGDPDARRLASCVSRRAGTSTGLENAMFIGYGRLVFAWRLQDVGKLCFLPERHCVMRQVEGGGLFCDTHARHPPAEAAGRKSCIARCWPKARG